MIRLIAAIDSKQGIADEHGIPWQGKIPSDVRYFRQQTEGGTILMGHRTYTEYKKPLADRRNLVLTTDQSLREGFEPIKTKKLDKFIKFTQEYHDELWVIGGAKLFEQTIEYADELYLTQLEGDFRCTKFFPDFKNNFELTWQSEPMTENNITYRFQIWKRKPS